jgi:hypothetical protein
MSEQVAGPVPPEAVHVLVSPEVAAQLRDTWSEPVHIMFEQRDGQWSLAVRRHPCVSPPECLCLIDFHGDQPRVVQRTAACPIHGDTPSVSPAAWEAWQKAARNLLT